MKKLINNKNFLYTVIFNLVVTILLSLLSFIINKKFSIYMGKENLGLMKLFTQLLAYINVIEIGIAPASTFALYKPLLNKNYEQISIIINTIKNLFNKISILILIIGISLNLGLNLIIKDIFFNRIIYLYWSLYVINTSLSYSFITYNILFLADQKILLIKTIQGISKIISQIFQIIMIVKYQSFLYFIIFLFLENILQYIFYKIYYKKYYSEILNFKTNKKDYSIIKNLKNLFWHKISVVVIFNTDFIIISKFISLETVAIYASYKMLTTILSTILNTIIFVLKPKIGNFIVVNSKENIFNYWKKLNIIFLGIGIIFAFSFYKLANKFIFLWLGKEYIFNDTTVIFITINLFLECTRGMIDIFKEGSGFFDDIHLPILEAIINFIASIILVQYLGVNGVIIGTILSNILIVCIAKPILVFKRCFDKSFKIYIKIYVTYIILVIISLLICNFILKFLPIREFSSWSNWIMNGMLISGISLIIVFIVFFNNKDFRNIFLLNNNNN